MVVVVVVVVMIVTNRKSGCQLTVLTCVINFK